MAGYTPRNSGSSFRAPVAGNTATQEKKAPAPGLLLGTGLFAPKPRKDGKESLEIASVKTKETVTIPAGSYINLYEVTDRKGDTSPIFKMTIKEVKPKA